MQVEHKDGRVVIIKAKRKSKGGSRDGRHGSTGKVGIVYEIKGGLREEIFRVMGPNFKEVSRQLRQAGYVSPNVTLNSREPTYL